MRREQEWRLRMVRRVAALVVQAQASRYLPTLQTLASQHGVCSRTIRRDLEALEAAGVPVRWRKVEAA